MKEIIVVYQDCPLCGARKEWGEKTLKEALNARARVRKVSFATREGEKLIYEAILKGYTRLPFVTDGEHFAYNVKTLLEAQSEAKKAKKQSEKEAKQKAKEAKRKAKVTDESD